MTQNADEVTGINIPEIFVGRLSNVQEFIDSYHNLYELYNGALKGGSNAGRAFDRTKNSVFEKEKEISGSLYTQAFVLLTGTAEVVLKDCFSTLVEQNFEKIRSKAGVTLKIGEVQNAFSQVKPDDTSGLEAVKLHLGKRLVKNIFGEKNTTEKINFQNVKTTEQILKRYFNLNFNVDRTVSDAVHCYWQERHVIVHNNAVIDERYRSNIRVVRELSEEESVGKVVTITKQHYDEAVDRFTEYFVALTDGIVQRGMRCEMEIC